MWNNRLVQKNLLGLLVSAGLLFGAFQPAFAEGVRPLVLVPLPYEQSALEPFISSQTIAFHYGKHHAAYVKTANELLLGNPLANKPIEEIIKATAGNWEQAALFNSAAQAWNHAFFWQCLKPKGGGKPAGKLGQMIDESFGSFDTFKEEFENSGKALFGSGWVWLVEDGKKLKIVKTSNAETPFTTGQRPIFVIDVWEHAYYLDFQNRRADFLKVVLENLANWEFAASNL